MGNMKKETFKGKILTQEGGEGSVGEKIRLAPEKSTEKKTTGNRGTFGGAFRSAERGNKHCRGLLINGK